MELAGYIASVFIGITLGFIGGGGSILTVPLLVYLFGINPVLATTYSLFVVGSTSLVGVFTKYRAGLVNFKTAFIFAIPAVLTIFITRLFLLPLVPEKIFTMGEVVITKSIALMLLFAILMIFASISMISKNKKLVPPGKDEPKFNYPAIFIQGAIVGLVTGMVGAGGGFLIIPALVLFSKLPIKEAIGTSLLIITINSFAGFLGSISHFQMEWKLLLSITGLAIGGIFIGNWFSNKMPAHKLKKLFGWFVLSMGIYILIREIWFPA